MFDYELIESLPKSDVLELEKSFELLKKRADTSNRIYTMQIPFILRQQLEPHMLLAGKLKLDAKVVKSFFECPVRNICIHIEEILRELRFHFVNTIILVGGFAESEILQSEIQNRFSTKRILSPTNSSTAVVNGAVEFGHCPEKIRYRMSPMTYGIAIVVPFEYDNHPYEKKIEIEGEEYCKDIFSIHVKKNQSVETGTPISDESYSPVSSKNTVLPIRVIESSNRNPTYVTDPGCRVIGRFQVEVPSSSSHLNRSVKVKMIFSGTELNVEARSVQTGRLHTSSFKFT